ncbi:GGDEF domain-containing protein [Vogesella oryzae]|uniref:GGDEF domain-containing protein n=1 Tax=Vogesella oryzae TaxID=1735285 RepID=UPI001FECCB5A|nr:GGDEF domain-containing protein [Vogesella oryzae]
MADRSGTMLAIGFLDLDGFKEINDQYGHQAGDTVLQEVARRMQASIRSGDTAARFGGDEFAVLLWGLQQQTECHHLLERMLQAVRQPIPLEQDSVQPAVSIGVALYPLDAAEPDVLLALADTAMYQSKTTGGNRISYHS